MSATGEVSSRRDVASMAFAAGLKLRGFVPRPTRTRREEEEVRSQGPKEDAAARQLARLPLDQRAQVRAGDLVVEGSGARRRRRARANRGVIGTTDRRAAVAQLLAVIGPRVAHVCAADRWSMVVK